MENVSLRYIDNLSVDKYCGNFLYAVCSILKFVYFILVFPLGPLLREEANLIIAISLNRAEVLRLDKEFKRLIICRTFFLQLPCNLYHVCPLRYILFYRT